MQTDHLVVQVDLANLYDTVKSVDRIEFVLEIYHSIKRFFNTFASPVLQGLITDGAITDYWLAKRESDDEIVMDSLSRVFKRSKDLDSTINNWLLEDLAMSRAEVIDKLKIATLALVEVSLWQISDSVRDYAESEAMRIDRVNGIVAVEDFISREGLPTKLYCEIDITLDGIKRIGARQSV